MNLKFYSEETKKFYDTEEELVKAEKDAKEQKELIEVSRKELAKKVEEADSRIELAYQSYEKAKEEVSTIIEDAKKKAQEILEPAKKEIKDAEFARAEAIQNFNSKYGVYTTTYTGKKAQQEYNRIVNHFNNIFKDAWKPFSWFW